MRASDAPRVSRQTRSTAISGCDSPAPLLLDRNDYRVARPNAVPVRGKSPRLSRSGTTSALIQAGCEENGCDKTVLAGVRLDRRYRMRRVICATVVGLLLGVGAVGAAPMQGKGKKQSGRARRPASTGMAEEVRALPGRGRAPVACPARRPPARRDRWARRHLQHSHQRDYRRGCALLTRDGTSGPSRAEYHRRFAGGI